MSRPSFHSGAALPTSSRWVAASSAADQMRAARTPAATNGPATRGEIPTQTPSTSPSSGTAARNGLLGWLTFGSHTRRWS